MENEKRKPISLSFERFDLKFYNQPPNVIPKLKKDYSFLFPEKFSDSIWENRQKDSLQLILQNAVQNEFPDLLDVESDITDLFERIKFQFPESKITIYDINPKQLEYSKWLNSHKIYPTQEQFNEYYKTLGRISVAEKFNPDNKNWAPADAEYRNIDILEQKLQSPTILSKILIYMPVYNKHGFAHVQDWKNQNSTFII